VSKRFWSWLPNSLTMLRMGLCPILVLSMAKAQQAGAAAWWIPIAIYLVCCLTDWVDGRIARRAGAASLFGSRLDVGADLAVILTADIVLCTYALMPLWSTIIVTAKFTEFTITSRVMRAANPDRHFWFDRAGRLAAGLFYTVPAVVMMERLLNIRRYMGLAGMYAAAALAVVSSAWRIAECVSRARAVSRTLDG
jgi:CDP-diacylglycerol--glycerol-3-phosphate 3-phosphatidyltransferase